MIRKRKGSARGAKKGSSRPTRRGGYPGPFIQAAGYDPATREITGQLKDGRAFRMPFSIFDMPEGDDGSKVLDVRVEPHGRAAVVRQESGHAFDFSVDFVLSQMGALPDGAGLAGRAKARAAGIASRIRELRERGGWDHEAFAARCGLKRPNIYRLESGKHVPSLPTLLKVSKGLGVSVKQLIVSEDPVHDGPEEGAEFLGSRWCAAGRDPEGFDLGHQVMKRVA
jgi:transcriptional regulator with XRE-family HTH domain